MSLLLLAAALFAAPPQAADDARPRPKPLAPAAEGPVIQMLVPGFEVRELPVALPNIVNLEYADDGRLFAAGYDGRLYLLRDTDADGLEDKATCFHDKASDDYPLGIVVRPDGLYLMRRRAVMRHRDTDADGVPDAEEVAADGWQDPEVDADKTKDKRMTHRRVDDALGLAIAPDGAFYITMGAANYSNGYLLDKEKKRAHLDLARRRGCVLRIPPGGKPEIVATGVRFIVSLQFNRHGDLFGTDQEGATWLPNGNPFDELLHLQPGRHYGFPPRHPQHLPDVVDEPSVFDYAPQHQSVCGFRFNERRPGRDSFGPPSWEGDALLTAMSRGKLYRTRLVKTAAGYVARNHLIASVNMLPVDASISPRGDLVVACHSGAPDWGSGPKGAGKIFKISWKNRTAARPLFAYPASPGETAVVFDGPLNAAEWKDLAKRTVVEGGLHVAAGDRFERFRPGYQVVKDQVKAPRWEYPILSAGLSADGRSILVRTASRPEALGYAVTLASDAWGTADLAVDAAGVEAEWAADAGAERWKGWLPHADLTAARALTQGSADHDRLWSLLEKHGRLTLTTKLDLKQMLQPAVQPGSTLDVPYGAETVTVTVRSGTPFRLEVPAMPVRAETGREASIKAMPGTACLPLTLVATTGPGTDVALSWQTDRDPRPRAFPLRRLLLPWAVPPGGAAAEAARSRPETEGGRWDEGKKIYFGERAACGKCHAIRGEGGRIGPDLTNLVHRDYESVMKDVAQPSAAINPDHLSYTVRLKSGDVLAGVIASSTPEAIVFGLATGETATVARANIELMEPSKISLMPEKLLEGMSREQVRDLMSFLLNPR